MAGAVTQQLMGEIRLAWWRENLEAIEKPGPHRHPVLNALSGPIRDGRLSRSALEVMVEARHADLDPDALGDDAARAAYVRDTAEAVMIQAARLLDAAAKPEMLASAARAWGWAGFVRAKRVAPEAARSRIVDALKAARVEVRQLPVAAFPAAAYATLAPLYLRGREASELEKRLRLVWATVRGRV